MSETVTAPAIRLAVTTASFPQVPPVDANTGEWPAMFKGSDTAFDLGVFNAARFPVSLANLESLKLLVYPYVPPQNYLGYPLEDAVDPIATVTVDAADITAVITTAQWDAGLTQNCTFVLPGDTSAAFDLQGQPYDKFTITIRGLKEGGGHIVYGSGPLMVYESGINSDGPTPPVPGDFTATESVTNSTGNTTITLEEGIVFLTVFATITGSAGTRNFILATTNAINGAKITLVVGFPATASIIVQARSGAIGNPVISGSPTTSDGSGDGVTLDFVFDGTAVEWKRVFGLYSN